MTEMVNWIEENMLANNRLRYNCLRDRIEIRMTNDELRMMNDRSAALFNGQLMGFNGEKEVPTDNAFNGQLMGINGENGKWRDLNERDLNEMTRQCCMECNIMVKPYEMDSVLKSHLIPTVDPLKDYLAQLEPYNPRKEGDWIQFVADMVRIKGEQKTADGQVPLPQAARKIEENDYTATDGDGVPLPQADGQAPLPQAARKIEENDYTATDGDGVPLPQADGQAPLPQAARKIEENNYTATDGDEVPMPQAARKTEENDYTATDGDGVPLPQADGQVPLPQAARKTEENNRGTGGIDNTYNNLGGNNGTDYMRERWNKCFRRWFLAMVESWRKDEVVNHQVLVLIGRQGIFKTTWLESLLPPCLRDYGTKFSGTFDKDDRLRIAESALINLDEIDAMTPRELNKMKALITAADINERKAFGHNKERRHRVASFCASGNRREFLSDTTGNRRWLSFEVESIDNPLEYFPFVRYDRLYAQALFCLDQLHEKYWFDAEDIAEIEEQNSDFRAMESEEELLGILFDIPATDAQGEQVKLLTTAEISAKLVAFGNIRKPMPLNRLSAIMRRMGYEQQRSGKTGIKRWRVYERNADEINLLRK